jgi:sulfoxide reductase heme-binding subunit YedZ
MWKDVAKRPFITVGFTALVLLVPLALTSTAGWIRRLGGRRWQMLHRAVYISAICGVIHYLWLVKSAIYRPMAYGVTLAVLLLWRLVDWTMRRGAKLSTAANAQRASANS